MLEPDYIREFKVKAKRDGKPISIGFMADVHIGLVNERDLLDEEIAGTYECRRWMRDGVSVPAFQNAMEYCERFDLTVLAGDILDYYTSAAREALSKEFDRHKNVMACVGGHDCTLQMQTDKRNKRSLTERFGLLSEFWCNDVQYASRVFDDRLRVVVLNNNSQHYRERTPMFGEEQYNGLRADIEEARKNGQIILISCHEPIPDGYGTEVFFDEVRNKATEYKFFPIEEEWEKKTYKLITESADCIKGIFCGHLHVDATDNISAGFYENGEFVKCDIPMYILMAFAGYKNGCIGKITVE